MICVCFLFNVAIHFARISYRNFFIVHIINKHSVVGFFTLLMTTMIKNHASSSGYSVDGSEFTNKQTQVNYHRGRGSRHSSRHSNKSASLRAQIPDRPMQLNHTGKLQANSHKRQRNKKDAVPMPMANVEYHSCLVSGDEYSDSEEEIETFATEETQETIPPLIPQSSDVPGSTSANMTNAATSEGIDQIASSDQNSLTTTEPPATITNSSSSTIENQSLSMAAEDVNEEDANEYDTKPIVTETEEEETPTADTKLVVPNDSSESPADTSYYMRVARILMTVIIVLVIGYAIYWITANVFGFDLWEYVKAKLTGNPSVASRELATEANNVNALPEAASTSSSGIYPAATPAPSAQLPPTTPLTNHFASSIRPRPNLQATPNLNGAQMRQKLSDQSAKALLDLMAKVQ